ncbi:acyl-CoA synthetase [Bellilinea caldifistulae]|uniref:AMP-dependent synthetase n=1 Tax=Bellilinea caldifistulae TaxID=360411 RepID=A0A0P6XS36_9CHLR|nr:class I adenylate-forming enzyme family protein [Bellilinea caldifistulae]KPL78044.1 AMP-dependent synthetase [Bellilinea caldifistulae]GAP10759.1 acyl-CoA synthetase [Bellilinea caldifistulae]
MTCFRLVQEFLEKSADRIPEKVALVCGDERLTYAEIEDRANRIANGLRFNGIQRGDRVALFMQNSVELVIGIFAILKCDAVFVVINATTKTDKLVYILNNCGVSALVVSPHQKIPIEEMRASCPSIKFFVVIAKEGELLDQPTTEPTTACFSWEQFLKTYPPTRLPARNIDLDLACLIYTSGSTGEPKGVMSDHSNIIFAVNSITSYIGNTEDDVVINVLPLSFDYGLYQLLMVFSFGGRLVLEKGFSFPAQILNLIEKEKVTGFPGVPTIFSMLVNMDLDDYDLSSLRYMTNTAAALPPAHILKIRDTFPHVRLYSMYGLTETKRTLYLPPSYLDTKPDSVGIAIPGTEVWIEDERGNRLGAGEVGELVVRGRHVMRGYWGDEELTAQRFRPGRIPGERLCYTGDLFKMDEEGFFYFVARKDDVIKSRGEKVSPKEVENVLYKIEGVHEVAVIGVEDALLGQAIKAFIVKNNSSLTETDVLRFCRNHLEDFMIPKIVQFVDELPKTSSGKIKKTELR